MTYNDRCPSGQEKKKYTSGSNSRVTEAECAIVEVDIHKLIQTDFSAAANA